MSEWKPEWDSRLRRPPLKRRRFGEAMMRRVESRVLADERNGKNGRSVERRALRHAASVAAPLLVCAVLGGIWLYGNPSTPLPPPRIDEPDRIVPSVPASSFQSGEGGDIDWWRSAAERDTDSEADRTLIVFVNALLERRLGVWGGASPDIWETPEVKQSLERYDVSSPWAYRVYVESVDADAAHSLYRLRILMRDSVPSVFTEKIDVRVRSDTNDIDDVKQVAADEIGSPVEPVALAEDPARDTTITGFLFAGEGMYRPIRVRRGATERTFDDWENSVNETYFPQIATVRAGASEEELLAVLLTTGHGTGVYVTQAKILQDDLSEIPVADPVLWTQDRLQSETTAEEGKRAFRIALNGETRSFEYKEDDAGFWFDRAAVGSIVRFAVEEDALYATLAVQVSPGMFPVSVRLRYAFDGTAFTVAEAAFEEHIDP